jgi:hypothetical protein
VKLRLVALGLQRIRQPHRAALDARGEYRRRLVREEELGAVAIGLECHDCARKQKAVRRGVVRGAVDRTVATRRKLVFGKADRERKALLPDGAETLVVGVAAAVRMVEARVVVFSSNDCRNAALAGGARACLRALGASATGVVEDGPRLAAFDGETGVLARAVGDVAPEDGSASRFTR